LRAVFLAPDKPNLTLYVFGFFISIFNAIELINPSKDCAVGKSNHLFIDPCFVKRKRERPSAITKSAAMNLKNEFLAC
jgi:hypothetical protein